MRLSAEAAVEYPYIFVKKQEDNEVSG